MSPRTRLIWTVGIIVGSSIYALLIALNPRVASALMLGYIGLLLTVFLVVEFWKKT